MKTDFTAGGISTPALPPFRQILPLHKPADVISGFLVRTRCFVVVAAVTMSALAASPPGAPGLPGGSPAVPRTADASWRHAAARRIEEHRKAPLEVIVTDFAGRPRHNATVSIKMTRHDFGFGALVGTSRWEDRPNAVDARRHLALVAERFNKVVTILNPAEPSSNAALDWLADHHIRVRGHYLMWAPLQPERARSGQPANVFELPAEDLAAKANARQRAAIRQAAFAHLERVLAFAGNRVAEWDAINHIANDAHVRFSDVFGAQIYADVIRRARELAPRAQMWVNEGNVLTAGNRLEKYLAIVSELIALGGKPDGLGFMAHFREGEITPAPEIYRRLDRFAALVPNLQLTELDIETSDERAQAGVMADVLTVAFSHPAVSGIVMWQVWGQGAGNKALWRPDWSIKPAGQVWLDHVFKLWWTDESGVTNAHGRLATRGFLGSYVIEVRSDGHVKVVPLQLGRDGARVTVSL